MWQVKSALLHCYVTVYYVKLILGAAKQHHHVAKLVDTLEYTDALAASWTLRRGHGAWSRCKYYQILIYTVYLQNMTAYHLSSMRSDSVSHVRTIALECCSAAGTPDGLSCCWAQFFRSQAARACYQEVREAVDDPAEFQASHRSFQIANFTCNDQICQQIATFAIKNDFRRLHGIHGLITGCFATCQRKVFAPQRFASWLNMIFFHRFEGQEEFSQSFSQHLAEADKLRLSSCDDEGIACLQPSAAVDGVLSLLERDKGRSVGCSTGRCRGFLHSQVMGKWSKPRNNWHKNEWKLLKSWPLDKHRWH